MYVHNICIDAYTKCFSDAQYEYNFVILLLPISRLSHMSLMYLSQCYDNYHDSYYVYTV